MRLLQPNLLRLFVLLLLTVFITETVYASGMMVAEHNSSKSLHNQNVSNYENHAEHCHDKQGSQQSHTQSHQEQQSHSSCSHCLACFSIIPQGQFSAIVMQTQMIEAASFVEIYLSPTSAQPQKPPIV